jgi:curved DNA-binding protein CbpA
MKDPYETLGVNRSATDQEIKEAFKKLARKFHPDLHPGDKEAEAKFKDISAANDLLKDKEKRRGFDAGEIDASGAEQPQERFYRDFADGSAYASHATQDGFANNEELEEFLARAFAGKGDRSQGTFRARGQDVSYVLPVGFLEVANSAARTITLPEGKTLQVTIPEGAEDRQMLRLKEQGMPGFGGGPAGDAYVELTSCGTYAASRDRPPSRWACYHTDLYPFRYEGREYGIVGCAVGAAAGCGIEGRTMMPRGLLHVSLCHSHALLDPVTWVQYDVIAQGEARFNLCCPIVPLADLDDSHPGAPVLDSEDSPVATLPKQGRHRHGQYVFSPPDRHVHDHSVIVTER